jgi:hypothetical protein
MRRAAAEAINMAALAVAAAGIGHYARGPFADPSLPRDLAAGALLIGATAALGWAAAELREPATIGA